MHVGTAGWSIPRQLADDFPGEGQHLQRYAQVLGCAEINSSFYRSHRFEVYERWAAQTSEDFRFAVKLPRTITHDARLRDVRPLLQAFLAEVAGLGPRLGVLLVQLPPSLAFEPRAMRHFADALTELGCTSSVVVEPRHASWFTDEADRALVALRIGRVGADPALSEIAQQPGGWMGGDGDDERGIVLYHRWHGSPRRYWSSYPQAWLRERAEAIREEAQGSSKRVDHWCIFDNTAAGAALANALAFQALLLHPLDR